MTEIKAVIFDCFGVIYPDLSWIYYKRHQKEFKNDEEFWTKNNDDIDSGKISRSEYFKRLEQKTGIAVTDAEAEMDSILVRNDEVINLIRELKKNYKIGLLSNAGEGELQALKKDGTIGLFDALTISYLTGFTKPDPRIFNKATETLGVKADECVFIDDKLSNIAAGEKLGMQIIHYRNFKQLQEDLTQILNA